MELLETISQNTAPKNSCYIVCRGNDSKLRTKFSPVLNSNGCEIAVVGLSTYYSYPNITDINNLLEICDDKETHHKIFLPKGCYEIRDINKHIKNIFSWDEGKEIIKISSDTVTLRTHISIKEKLWHVIFPEKNSLGSILGFKSGDYSGEKTYTSQKIANILSVNNILVQCDVISGSSINGEPAPVIFNYSPNVQAGRKIVAEPVIPIYLPVTVDHIHELNVWITDQDNFLLDIQQEDIVVTFHLRSR